MVIALISLILVCIACMFVIRNLLIKLEAQEDWNEELETWMVNVTRKIQDSHSRLRQIDRRGSFESDDEVGFIFKDLKQLVEELNQLVIGESGGMDNDQAN